MDGHAYDEALRHIAVPTAAAADLVRKRPDVLQRRKLERKGGEEAPTRARTPRTQQMATCEVCREQSLMQ